MPHKYDVFLQVAKKGQLLRSDLILSNKGYFIQQLEQEKLITQSKDTLCVRSSNKAKQLYSLLAFCLANNLDYQFYTRNSTLNFLEHFFSSQRQQLSINQQTKIRRRFKKDSFLVYFSQKPLDYIILPHTFFKELLSYFNLQYSPKELPALKIKVAIAKIRAPKKTTHLSTFIHTSLQLEGNLLTLRQTQQVLSENVALNDVRPKDILETTNYNRALLMSASLKSLSYQSLLQIHSIAMAHEEFAGKFRKERVVIKNNPAFKIATHTEIQDEIGKLFSWTNSVKKQPLRALCEDAAYLHNQLQYIHPFIDGNSRTTRLITQWFFEKHNCEFDIPLGFTSLYVQQTKGYKTRNDAQLASLLMLILISLSQRDE